MSDAADVNDPVDTNDTMSVESLRDRDRSAFSAYMAASGVYGALDGDMVQAVFWPRLGRGPAGGNAASEIAIVLEVLAPFCRANPRAPAEAVFRHAAAAGIHDVAPAGFGAVALGGRAAYSTFLSSLQAIDAMGEADRLQAEAAAPTAPETGVLRVDIEDTILRGSGDLTAIQQAFGEERVVTIIPGTGLPPGHNPAQRPAPPPIGGDNVQKAGTFFPTAQAAPAPAVPEQPPAISGAPMEGGSIAPGGAVPLGHGFDASEPFVEMAGAPNPAATDAAAQAAVAEPPASPLGVDDDLGVRNAPESGGAPPVEPPSPTPAEQSQAVQQQAERQADMAERGDTHGEPGPAAGNPDAPAPQPEGAPAGIDMAESDGVAGDGDDPGAKKSRRKRT